MQYLKDIFKTVKKESPILYWIVIIHLIGTAGCIVGIMVDDRMLLGINIWIKPLKFFISTGIYILTVGYLITLYPFSSIKKHIIRNIVSISLLLEMIIITIQAARGTQSHFNFSTELDSALFGLMGILIAVNVLVMILFAFETIRLKLYTIGSIRWAILLAWLITILGSWVGGQMIGQMAHNVGIQDGGPGIPLFNWSTIAGDLRVAHFFGLHGLQITPIFAYFLSKKWQTKDSNRIVLLTIFALIYASFIFFTYYQAAQGLPFIHSKSF